MKRIVIALLLLMSMRLAPLSRPSIFTVPWTVCPSEMRNTGSRCETSIVAPPMVTLILPSVAE